MKLIVSHLFARQHDFYHSIDITMKVIIYNKFKKRYFIIGAVRMKTP